MRTPSDQQLGDYQLGETVETGTHTIVYRARRASDARQVLVKTLKPGLRINDDLKGVFARERRLLETADHPALPTVVELIDEPDAIALVYLDRRGHRLESVLERGTRISATTAVAIALELCAPLAALHRAGETHGGLRAAVVELSEGGGVFLHGLADQHRRAGDELALPDHLAPEQLLGDRAEPPTDVFALGALLYRMIGGALPFSRADGSMSQSIRHAQPKSLSLHQRSVPASIERIVMRCLNKRAAERYADATALASALAQALAAETSLPNWVLVSRALAAAGLSDELPQPRETAPLARKAFRPPPWMRRAYRPVAIGLAAILALGVGWYALSDSDGDGPLHELRRPAQLRVVARPWAEVHLDGKLIDVTPIGMPIEVSPGRHKVVFKHPNAPDELRTIDVAEGQTVVLDVEMSVAVPVKASAEPEPDADAEEEP